MRRRSLPIKDAIKTRWMDVRDGDSPLASVVESFLLDRSDLSDRTRVLYSDLLRQFSERIEETQKRPAAVADVNPDIVNDYVRHRERSSRHQARNACVALKSLAKFLAIRGIWHDQGLSVLRHVRIPQTDVVRRHLQDDEVRKVVAEAERGRYGVRDRALVMLILGTGLRLNEIANLHLSDLDFAESILLVSAESTKGRPGRRREREVTLPREVLRELDHYLRDFRKGGVNPEALLFTDRSGAPLSRQGIAQIFRRIKRRTGMEALCAHALRHTWATRFRRVGSGDLFDLQEEGGWSDLRMVRRYAKGRPREERRRAPSPLSGLFDKRADRRSSAQAVGFAAARSA